jgi:glycosyltransferase involved in cell wall biosynthesis
MNSNTRQPLVSVIMPTYNHSKFIDEAIESVLNQTYKNFELIIIDNYSEDDTEKVVTSYKDNRIKYLKFKNNGIIAASRNYGIKNSNGEYVAFLDSDDIWLPKKLEKQIELFRISNETPMIYTRFKTVRGDTISKDILPKNGRYKSGYIFRSLYVRPFITCSTVIVKKSIFNQIGLFDTNRDLIAIEDMDLWLRIALKYPVEIADISPLVLYRIQSQSISLGSARMVKRSLIIAKRYKKYAGNHLFAKSVFLLLMSVCKNMLSRSPLNDVSHRLLSDSRQNNNDI